jgi:CrcB protein
MMNNYLWVFLGGGLGSICRYAMGRWISNPSQQFPWATLVINVLSGLIIGVLAGLTLKGSLRPNYQLLLMTGFCGGLSTFSTFSYETLKLLQGPHPILALVYIGASVIFCLIMVYLGMKIVL